ncbi:MAG TPA: hypothetical protein VGB52_15305 [Actinomycetota bacterium]
MTGTDAAAFASRARAEREAAIGDAFAAVGTAHGVAYEDALGSVAHLVAMHGAALSRETARRLGSDALAQRLFARTYAIIDGHRWMGRISNLDEVYRIFVVDHRLAARAETVGDPGAVRAFHDELLFGVCPQVPAGELLPPSTDLAPDPAVIDARTLARSAGRRRTGNRMVDSFGTWEAMLRERSVEEVAEVDRAQRLDRKEHARAKELAAWGVRAFVISEAERAAITEALGKFSKDGGGWPEGTSTARKAAVSEAIASLHDAFSSLI